MAGAFSSARSMPHTGSFTIGLPRLPAHRYLRYPQCGLRVRYRHALAVLAAGAYAEAQVASDHVYLHEDLRAVASEGCAAHRLAHLPVLYEVAFSHLEYEVTVYRVDLAAAHLPYKQALVQGLNDGLGAVFSRRDYRIGHPRNGPVVVGFPPAVASRFEARFH